MRGAAGAHFRIPHHCKSRVPSWFIQAARQCRSMLSGLKVVPERWIPRSLHVGGGQNPVQKVVEDVLGAPHVAEVEQFADVAGSTSCSSSATAPTRNSSWAAAAISALRARTTTRKTACWLSARRATGLSPSGILSSPSRITATLPTFTSAAASAGRSFFGTCSLYFNAARISSTATPVLPEPREPTITIRPDPSPPYTAWRSRSPPSRNCPCRTAARPGKAGN